MSINQEYFTAKSCILSRIGLKIHLKFLKGTKSKGQKQMQESCSLKETKYQRLDGSELEQSCQNLEESRSEMYG